jgi:hypothetical protein
MIVIETSLSGVQSRRCVSFYGDHIWWPIKLFADIRMSHKNLI